jgi:hypothetical protein
MIDENKQSPLVGSFRNGGVGLDQLNGELSFEGLVLCVKSNLGIGPSFAEPLLAQLGPRLRSPRLRSPCLQSPSLDVVCGALICGALVCGALVSEPSFEKPSFAEPSIFAG